MNLLRLLFLILVVGTVVYVALAWFLRSTTRERLEKAWDAANPDRDISERAAEVEDGVEEFKTSLLYRSLWLIYIIPIVLVIIAFFTTN